MYFIIRVLLPFVCSITVLTYAAMHTLCGCRFEKKKNRTVVLEFVYVVESYVSVFYVSGFLLFEARLYKAAHV